MQYLSDDPRESSFHIGVVSVFDPGKQIVAWSFYTGFLNFSRGNKIIRIV